jgi:hypothetical protein
MQQQGGGYQTHTHTRKGSTQKKRGAVVFTQCARSAGLNSNVMAMYEDKVWNIFLPFDSVGALIYPLLALRGWIFLVALGVTPPSKTTLQRGEKLSPPAPPQPKVSTQHK